MMINIMNVLRYFLNWAVDLTANRSARWQTRKGREARQRARRGQLSEGGQRGSRGDDGRQR